MEGDWQLVACRKHYPASWKRSWTDAQPQVKTYTPYDSKPSYAQVLLSRPLSPPGKSPSNPKHLNTSTPSPPSSPPPSNASFYISPHSPSQLRFPPSPYFPEWCGRCFRCCRRGHNATTCRNPMKCGKCWCDGHIGNRYKGKNLNPAAMPYWSQRAKRVAPQLEKLFDDLLQEPYPVKSPTLPDNRPLKNVCFMERDGAYFQELNRLERGVVMHSEGLQTDLLADDVAKYAAETGIVRTTEISVGLLTKGRYLIILPERLAPDTFIKATPQSLSDLGLSFQPWSPLDDAQVVIPEFEALVDFIGIPPHLYRKREVARMVSGFGTYLGSVAQSNPANIACWTAAIATDRLERIPDHVSIWAGGLEFV